MAIQKNRDVITDSKGDLWKNDFWGVPMSQDESHHSYRPLTVLTYRWNFLRGGLEVINYHITNVMIHGVTTTLFFFFSKKVVQRTSCATLAALLFAVHPIHTEAVAGLVGRADALACLFFLLALLVYDKTRKMEVIELQAIGLLMTGVLTVCATLCKETGVTVLAICGIYDIGRSPKPNPNLA